MDPSGVQFSAPWLKSHHMWVSCVMCVWLRSFAMKTSEKPCGKTSAVSTQPVHSIIWEHSCHVQNVAFRPIVTRVLNSQAVTLCVPAFGDHYHTSCEHWHVSNYVRWHDRLMISQKGLKNMHAIEPDVPSVFSVIYQTNQQDFIYLWIYAAVWSPSITLA